MQACALDSADMDEGVLAAVVRLDEAIALCGVEPLHGSRSHGNCLSRHRMRPPRTRQAVEFALVRSKSGARPEASPVLVRLSTRPCMAALALHYKPTEQAH